MSLKPQTRLRYKDGRTGTTTPTHPMLLSDGDGPMSFVFDGEASAASIAEPGHVGVFEVGDFTSLGPENAVADDACGLGKAAQCCVYATLGPKGIECSRFTSLGRFYLRFRADMGAKRRPLKGYPDCKTDEGEGPAT